LEAFRTQIEENSRLNIPLKAAKDIEEVIAEFSNVIQKAVWCTTPDDKPQTKYPEYPWVVRDQIKEKRNLRSRWQMRRHPEDRHGYNEAARNLKYQIKGTANTDYSLWNATKRLKQTTERIPPIRSANQTWARSDKVKANTLAGYLEKTFKPNEMPQNEAFRTEFNKPLKDLYK
jgi:hypothetical protein